MVAGLAGLRSAQGVCWWLFCLNGLANAASLCYVPFHLLHNWKGSPSYRLHRNEHVGYYALGCSLLHCLWWWLRPDKSPSETWVQLMVPVVCACLLSQPTLYLILDLSVLSTFFSLHHFFILLKVSG